MPRRPSPLPKSASVVIVGGGVIGTSAAFHLAEAGADVVLIERAALGGGSTSKAAGGVRTQFSDVLNIEIAKRSLDAFRDFGRRPGWEIDLKLVGYLFVLTRPSDVEEFARSVALQNQLGLDSRILTARRARSAFARCSRATTSSRRPSPPDDGHATPEGVVQGLRSAARTHGAHIRVGCEVVAIVSERGQIRRCHKRRRDQDGGGDLRRRRLVASVRRDGRGRAACDTLCGGRSCSPRRSTDCPRTCP